MEMLAICANIILASTYYTVGAALAFHCDEPTMSIDFQEEKSR